MRAGAARHLTPDMSMSSLLGSTPSVSRGTSSLPNSFEVGTHIDGFSAIFSLGNDESERSAIVSPGPGSQSWLAPLLAEVDFL